MKEQKYVNNPAVVQEEMSLLVSHITRVLMHPVGGRKNDQVLGKSDYLRIEKGEAVMVKQNTDFFPFLESGPN